MDISLILICTSLAVLNLKNFLYAYKLKKIIKTQKESIENFKESLIKKECENTILKTEIENLKLSKDSIQKEIELLCSKVIKQSENHIKDSIKQYYENIEHANSKESQINRANIKNEFAPILQQINSMKENLAKSQNEYIQECSHIKKHLIVQEKHCMELNKHTKMLSQALSTPNSRGKWGEMQLRKIIEMCGLVSYCDFQQQYTCPDGKRPDLVIKLPGNKKLAVDAKSPMKGFLDALDEPEDIRNVKLKEHIVNLKKHIQLLSNKDYCGGLESFSFVVLFLPNENILAQALSLDPDLIEWSANKNVVLTTPATTIALLKSIAMCWSNQKSLENSEKIAALSAQILKFMDSFLEKIMTTKKVIDKLNLNFDGIIKSANNQIMPSLNKMGEMYGPLRKNDLKSISKHQDEE